MELDFLSGMLANIGQNAPTLAAGCFLAVLLFRFLFPVITKKMDEKDALVRECEELRTRERTIKRDGQISDIEGRIDELDRMLDGHIKIHLDFEKGIKAEMAKIFERLNPIAEQVNYIKGKLDR